MENLFDKMFNWWCLTVILIVGAMAGGILMYEYIKYKYHLIKKQSLNKF